MEALHYEESGEVLPLRDFFRRYRHQLPQLLKVTDGFYSPNDDDTFASDQIIFVSSYATQTRVLAIETEGKGRILSLPKSYSVPFRLHKKTAWSQETPGLTQSLESIVTQCKLPVKVDMITKSVPVLVQDSSANGHVGCFSTLRLLDVFSEVFLVGNMVEAGLEDGRLYTQPIPVPLYLNHVTVTRLVGQSCLPVLEWSALLQGMANRVASLQRKVRLNSEDIIIYSKNSGPLPKGPRKPITEEDTVYDSFTPLSVVTLMSESVKKTQSLERKPLKKSLSNARDYQRPRSFELLSQKSTENDETSHYETLKNPLDQTQSEDGMSSPSSRQSPKPTGSKAAKPPPPPQRNKPRPPQTSVPTPAEGDYLTPQFNPYGVARSAIERALSLRSSTPNSDYILPSRAPPPPPPPPPPPRNRTTSQSSAMTSPEECRPVESLTISDVCEKLRLLNLDRHQVAFKSQMVDGVVLSRLKQEDLKSDFNMTSAEAIRLTLFVTEGHIPK